MKPILFMGALLLGVASTGYAQSTTGSRSGGSTASTGAGYDVNRRVKAADDQPNSMTSTNPRAAREGFAEKYVKQPAGSTRSSSRGRTGTSGNRSGTGASNRKNP